MMRKHVFLAAAMHLPLIKFLVTFEAVVSDLFVVIKTYVHILP